MKFGLIICAPSLIKVERSLERSFGAKGSMNTVKMQDLNQLPVDLIVRKQKGKWNEFYLKAGRNDERLIRRNLKNSRKRIRSIDSNPVLAKEY